MVPPDSDRVSPAPPYSGYDLAGSRFRIRGFHALRPAFPGRSPNRSPSTMSSYNPGRAKTPPVWAAPRSLATTCGITIVFSSCGYLDVSVPRVRPTFSGDAPSGHRVPPFGNPGINGHLRLPRAYRSLSRPSSPLRAQASPVRSYLTFSSRVSIVKVFRPASSNAAGRLRLILVFVLLCALFPNMSIFLSRPLSEAPPVDGRGSPRSHPAGIMRQGRDSSTADGRSCFGTLFCTLERRYSSRTFRYGYLVTT